QAEDGIRDDLVTGVQTCALPIYRLTQQKAEFTATVADLTRARDVLERRMQVAIDAANQALDERALNAKAAADHAAARETALLEQIGRASCRERAGRPGRAGTRTG